MNLKNKLILLSVLSIITSCSDNDETTTEPAENDNFKFITYVNEDNGDEEVIIGYSNSLLETYSDVGETYNFNLDSENKIQSGTTTTEFAEFSYLYSNNKLNQVTYDYGTFTISELFSYDSNNNVSSIIEEPEQPFDQDDYYTYDNNNNLISRQIGSNGSIYTFVFDDKTNPFYPLWKVYNLNIDSELAVYDIVPFFAKHNPLKIYRNGELILEAEYNYDSDGYPITCNFTRNSTSGSIVFNY